jgi:soluble lytic murein transglycosylase-like protein
MFKEKLQQLLGGMFQPKQREIIKPLAEPLGASTQQQLPAPAFGAYGALTDTNPQSFDAQINKFIPSGSVVIDSTPNELRDSIYRASQQHNIPAREYSALLQTEGGFRPEVQSGQVRSGVGAMGTNQFMPQTLEELQRVGYGKVDPYNPQESIPAGAFYLRHLMDLIGSDDFYDGAQAYNAGPGNFQKFGGNVPFDETQNYIRKIRELSAR